MTFWIIVIVAVALYLLYYTNIKCSNCGEKIGWNKRLKFKDGALDQKCIELIGSDFDSDSKKWAAHTEIKPILGLIKEGKKIDPQEVLEKVTAINRAEQQKANAQASRRADKKAPHCPKCGSRNIQAIGKHHKNFSAGKAVAGAALVGGVGAVAGLAGRNTKKVDMVCMDCGKKFKL